MTTRQTGEPPVAIRPAEGADAPALEALEAACFDDPWSEVQLAAEIGRGGSLVLVAERALPPATATTAATVGAAPGLAAIAGYASFRRAADEGELLRLAVRPAHRGHGLARAILADGCSRLAATGVASLHLEVDELNHTAIALYEGLGFHRVGRRPGYYRGGHGALLYARPLHP